MRARLIIIIFLLMMSGCVTLPKHYFSPEIDTHLDLDSVLTDIESSNAVFVGELHATPQHHKVQLEVIKHLYTSGKKVAIAFELFTEDRQDVLDGWNTGKFPESDFSRMFKANIHFPFRYYRDIFVFARDAGIPVFGINAQKNMILQVARNGLSAAPEELLKQVHFSSCAENSSYEYLIGLSESRQYHSTGMPYLCDAQRLRDATMSFNVAKILDKGFTVVVLTGVTHAAKPAMPDMLKEFTSIPYKVLLPRNIKHIIHAEPDLSIADYLWY